MKKTLYRSRDNRVFAGVAGGLAEYFDIDPVIIRILFVVIFFAGGASFFAYIIMIFVIPKKPLDQYSTNENISSFSTYDNSSKNTNKKITFGIILIILGALIFLDNIVPDIPFHMLWPLALIAIGALIIYKNFMNTSSSEANNEI